SRSVGIALASQAKGRGFEPLLPLDFPNMGRVPVSVGIRVPFFAPSSAVSYYVYILYSASHDKYYIGQTNDVGQRLKRHNNGLEKFNSLYSPLMSKCIF